MSGEQNTLVPVDDERDELAEDQDFYPQDGPALFDGSTGSQTTTSGSRAPEAPLALYRRYRPEIFAEVIGQDHVTEPLKRALANNRVNHAYLFSGPRGCGKTSSARILARSLNCEQGPTPTPCGVCQSCRDLARGGPGSIDVIEIDAASHGGVDDARDLRERAFFAPVHSRYKIYIVDEAHMVTTAGFNALLKLVEEPPPHVKFIFATTEPDKVIGTIRSRTHHYPFRLIPPKTMTAFLTQICEEEHVEVEPGVIPMVVRAGSGSVRDSLSILDQLFGGATDAGVGYAQAAALLGYTPDSLLDSVVDSIAASDSRGVFAGIDKVIETGQDPRRFTEDLLTRLRDLVIVAAVPDALSSGLLDVPDDQADRYRAQATQIGVGGLTRAAEVLAAGLVAMRGTTTPRLQLELMCARILLPGADASERGIHARLERLERRLGGPDQGMGAIPAAQPGPAPRTVTATGDSAGGQHAPGSRESGPRESAGSGYGPGTAPAHEPTMTAPPAGPTASAVASGSMGHDGSPARTGGATHETASASWQGQSAPASRPVAPTATPAGSTLTTEDIRRAWPRILARVASARRYIWSNLRNYMSDGDMRGNVLWLTFRDPLNRDNFNKNNGEDLVAQAILAELGATVLVRARLESEPIPNDGTAILSLARPPSGGAARTPGAGQPGPGHVAGYVPGHAPLDAPDPGDWDSPGGAAPAQSGPTATRPAEGGYATQDAQGAYPIQGTQAAQAIQGAQGTQGAHTTQGARDAQDTQGAPAPADGAGRADQSGSGRPQQVSAHQPGADSRSSDTATPSATSSPAQSPTASTPGAATRTAPGAQARATAKARSTKHAAEPAPEMDAPSEDDVVVENPADQAAELVMELFDAELVSEEQTKPPSRKRG